MFAADGGVAESSQSGTPQGDGENKAADTDYLNVIIIVKEHLLYHVLVHVQSMNCVFLYD